MQVKYHSEIRTVPFGDGMITVENLIPIFPPNERERRRREVETRLYNVFRKYTEKP